MAVLILINADRLIDAGDREGREVTLTQVMRFKVISLGSEMITHLKTNFSP